VGVLSKSVTTGYWCERKHDYVRCENLCGLWCNEKNVFGSSGFAYLRGVGGPIVPMPYALCPMQSATSLLSPLSSLFTCPILHPSELVEEYHVPTNILEKMHPLVRDLYKRAMVVGRDYPHPRGMDFVRETWKKAIRDQPTNFNDPKQMEKEIRKLVGKGRYAIREMIGVIQLKKYRTMRRRYDGGTIDANGEAQRIMDACKNIK